MKRIAILAPLALMACMWQLNPTHHYDLDIETGFTSDQHKMIVQAGESWTAATNGMIIFGQIDHAGDPTTITVTGMPIADLQSKWGDGTAGVCWWTGGENSDLYLSTDVDPDTFKHIALHELGHALGLDHTGSGTVMCAYNSCASHGITCADVEQFCRIWNCNAWDLPICKYDFTYN